MALIECSLGLQCVVIVFCYIATCTILIYESTAVLAKNQKGPHCIHNHSVSFRRRANIGLPGGKKVLPAMCVQKYRTNGNGVMQFCWVLCYGRSAFPFTTFADRRLRVHIKNRWNYIYSFDVKTSLSNNIVQMSFEKCAMHISLNIWF